MRFFRPGLLAIEQKALYFDFPDRFAPPPFEDRDGIAVITVRGPLVHHGEGWFDSYDEVKARVTQSVIRKPKAILLSIDSPGGLVSGCFDTATEIRALCENANIPLYAYVDGTSCSGGLALAMAADTIFIPPAGVVGSIGVIEGIVDETQMDARVGIAFTFVASGVRKLDGNPHTSPSDETIAVAQRNVDAAAEQFFELVADARGLTVEQVRGFQAGVFIGQQAIDAGLADELATEDEAIAQIAQWAETSADPSATEGNDTMKTLAEIKAALKAVAEGDGDEKEKEEAGKMLSAIESDEPDGDEPKPEPAAAEGGETPPDDDDDDDDEPAPVAAASSSMPAASATDSSPLALAARLQKVEADNAARAEADKQRKAAHAERKEKAQLLASRPDFTPQVRSFLEKQPLATVRDAVKTFAKGVVPVVQNPAAAVQGAARPTLGEGQGGQSTQDLRNLIKRPETDEEIMDRKMGLARSDPSKAIHAEGSWMVYGCLTPEEARRLQAKQSGQSG